MARFALTCAFLAALLVAAQATDFSGAGRHLLQDGGARAGSSARASSNDSDGSAVAESGIKVTEGSGFAEALATTEINEQSIVAVKDIWIRLMDTIPDDATCEDARLTAETEVQESVSAIAEVYASAFGSVTVDGTGEGCANAAASGDATAEAYLAVVIDVALELTFEGDAEKANEAFASAYGNLVIKKVATAWAEAFASGCAFAEDGESFILAEQNSFARAVASPIIIAYVWAEVGQTCGEAAFSDSEIAGLIDSEDANLADVDSVAIVRGNGTADATGDAAAVSTEVPAGDNGDEVDERSEQFDKCSGSQVVCCNTDDDICHCTLSSRESAFRCAATKEVGTTKTLWTEDNADADTGAFTCWCDN